MKKLILKEMSECGKYGAWIVDNGNRTFQVYTISPQANAGSGIRCDSRGQAMDVVYDWMWETYFDDYEGIPVAYDSNDRPLNDGNGNLTRWGYLEALAGQEVLSTHYEGCVLVDTAGAVWKNGSIIDSPSDKTLSVLYNEYCVQEGFQ